MGLELGESRLRIGGQLGDIVAIGGGVDAAAHPLLVTTTHLLGDAVVELAAYGSDGTPAFRVGATDSAGFTHAAQTDSGDNPQPEPTLQHSTVHPSASAGPKVMDRADRTVA